MARTDTSRDKPSWWRSCWEEIRRCARILLGRSDVGAAGLPWHGRIGRLWVRLGRFDDQGRIRCLLNRRVVPGGSAVVFLSLTFLLVLAGGDGWSGITQGMFMGALLTIGGATAWFLHRGVPQCNRYCILAGLSIYVILLGSYAMRDCFTGRVPIFAHIYYSLLLFTGSTGAEACQEVPFSLQVAELGGLIVLFATVLAVINEISSGPIARWRASLASRVILVTGLSDDTLPVIRSLTADPDRCLVVVAEPNPDHPLIHQARRYGARVIKGEISTRTAEQRWLKGMCKAWGRRVSLRRAYLLADDEQANLQAAEVIREVLTRLGPDYRDEHRAPTRLIVRIDRYRPARHHAAEQTSWWRIDDRPTTEPEPDLHTGPRVFISTLGTTQVTAHALAEHIATRGRPSHLVVVGESDLSHALDDEWRLQRASAGLLLDRMTTDPTWRDALERQARLPEPHHRPTLPDAAELQQLCVDGRDGRDGRVSVILAQEPDETTRSRLESLAVELTGQPIRIFIPTTGVRGLTRAPLLGCLHLFGPSLGGGVVEPHEQGGSTQPTPLHGVPQDSWFRAAKLVADSYGIDESPSSWDSLTATDRDSNLRAVWSLLTWLAELGYTWSTTRPEGHQPPSDDLLGLLVPLEHLAWMTFKHDTGWIGSDGENNDRDRRLNRFLHPLDELDDTRREEAVRNTRDNLRGLLGILEILGFHPVAPKEPHDHWWRFRRVGDVTLLETLTEARTWHDDNGNDLTAAPGDLWIADDTDPPGSPRSITAERFTATHRHVGEDRYERTGTCDARVAAVGERVDSTEGPQVAGPDSWVMRDPSGARWIITSAELAQGHVIEEPVRPTS
ncbi:hypothetical protein EII34_09475 [Arachnia propionica]|uniref:Uncharacterized protein n=1 Tax=Arachnia propionica TaxID=1750 RepID=A0A3P1T5D1_9ACTN|nr:hypothetical protein [Arachnia propionica]RRD04528.1 hypothetical protein EII34_09475 [Arachnia propionica]